MPRSEVCERRSCRILYPKRIKYVYSGSASWCILYEDTTVYCWRNGAGGEANPPGDGWLTANTDHSGFAFLNRDGSIWSGAGGGANTLSSIGYPTDGNWTAIYAAGTDYGFAALSTTGQIYSWGCVAACGLVSGYQFDNPNHNYALRHPQGYTAIQPGYSSYCALWIDGTIECWGTLPVDGSGIQPAEGGFVALYGNRYSYVAVHADGRAYAWGKAYYGGDQPSEGLVNVVRVFSNRLCCTAH